MNEGMVGHISCTGYQITNLADLLGQMALEERAELLWGKSNVQFNLVAWCLWRSGVGMGRPVDTNNLGHLLSVCLSLLLSLFFNMR